MTLDLHELAQDLLPGHSIRLTVTPSLFPLYACNPQTADYANAAKSRRTKITLRHDAQSMLQLPEA